MEGIGWMTMDRWGREGTGKMYNEDDNGLCSAVDGNAMRRCESGHIRTTKDGLCPQWSRKDWSVLNCNNIHILDSKIAPAIPFRPKRPAFSRTCEVQECFIRMSLRMASSVRLCPTSSN